MSVIINREPTSTTGLRTYRFTIPGGGVGQDGVYACSQYDLTPDPKGVTQAAYNQGSSQNATTTTNAQGVVSRFFDSSGVDGNPIIKAFESTKGKGLAGFIKSLKLTGVMLVGKLEGRTPGLLCQSRFLWSLPQSTISHLDWTRMDS